MRKKTVRTWIVLLCAVTLPLAAPVSDKVQARGEAGTDGNRSTVDYSSSRSIFEQGMDFARDNYNAAVDWVTGSSMYHFAADSAYDIGNGDSWTGILGGAAYDQAIGYATNGIEWGFSNYTSAGTQWVKSIGIAGAIVGAGNGLWNNYTNIVNSPYASNPVMDTMTSFLDNISVGFGPVPNPAARGIWCYSRACFRRTPPSICVEFCEHCIRHQEKSSNHQVAAVKPCCPWV